LESGQFARAKAGQAEHQVGDASVGWDLWAGDQLPEALDGQEPLPGLDLGHHRLQFIAELVSLRALRGHRGHASHGHENATPIIIARMTEQRNPNP
jgi:hypothetical protein